ncbi:hypothetical protein AAHH67_09055 [Niallia circulans]
MELLKRHQIYEVISKIMTVSTIERTTMIPSRKIMKTLQPQISMEQKELYIHLKIKKNMNKH